MTCVTSELSNKGIALPPKWLPGGMVYETIMGSVAYGVSEDASDTDLYGICIPPKDYIFPHLRGEILGFGTPGPRFDQFQQHHVLDKEKNRSYDVSIYGIVRYFQLAMDNNPNMVDSLFTPVNCVTYISPVGQLIRDNRKLFLHKGSWHKFKGYAYSQLHKINTKTPTTGSKRAENVEKFGFDVKFAYHVIRLLDEVEQILSTGDLDIQRDRERLKAVRRGEWSHEQVTQFFMEKERTLEEVYHNSKLPYSPQEEPIKELLLNCLEHHYGSLEKAISIPGKERELLLAIKNITDRYA